MPNISIVQQAIQDSDISLRPSTMGLKGAVDAATASIIRKIRKYNPKIQVSDLFFTGIISGPAGTMSARKQFMQSARTALMVVWASYACVLAFNFVSNHSSGYDSIATIQGEKRQLNETKSVQSGQRPIMFLLPAEFL